MAAGGASSSAVQDKAFYVTVTGQIEAAQFDGAKSLYCRFEFVHGGNWETERGDGEKTVMRDCCTQIAEIGGNQGVPLFVWNYPLEVTFRGTNPHGWPQLCVSVYTADSKGREEVKGYGCIHVPCGPGRYDRYIRLFAPVASSALQGLIATFTGKKPHFVDPTFPSKGEGREVTRVSSQGVVKVLFNITTRGFGDHYSEESAEFEEHVLSDISDL